MNEAWTPLDPFTAEGQAVIERLIDQSVDRGLTELRAQIEADAEHDPEFWAGGRIYEALGLAAREMRKQCREQVQLAARALAH
jgi:hypothetical protein